MTSLAWVHRPLRFAAPGVPFSIQPVVFVHTTAPQNPAQPIRRCHLSSPVPTVRFVGSTTTSVTFGLCMFVGVGILSGPTDIDIPIMVTVNTSGTMYPRFQPSSNRTFVRLAQCRSLLSEGGAQRVYALSSPRSTWNGNATVIHTDVDGYYFAYEFRERTQCHLNMSLGGDRFASVATQAQFGDMCTVRCTFTQDSVDFGSAFLHWVHGGAGTAQLHLSVNGVRIASTCTGTQTGAFLTGPHNVCQTTGSTAADGCTISLVKPSVSHVTFVPNSFTQSVAFVATSGRFTVPLVTILLCDANNNTVLVPPDVGALLSFLPPAVPQTCDALVVTVPTSEAHAAYGLTCANVSSLVSQSDTTCGSPAAAQPLHLRFQQDVGGQDALVRFNTTYCVRNNKVNATYVTALRILNEATVLGTADNASPLPVPLELELLNWLGETVTVPLDTLDASSQFPLEVQVLKNGSVVQRLLRNVSLSQTPVVLANIVVNVVAGSGYGLRVVALRDEKANVTLWGTQYPRNKSLHVYDCSSYATAVTLQEVVYTVPNDTLSCGRTAGTQSVVNRVPLRLLSASATVTVYGWHFDYAFSNQLMCHYSSLADPFRPGGLTPQSPARWISSCMALCTIPAQAAPLSSSSSFFVDTASGQVRAKSDPGSYSADAIANLGLLRLWLPALQSWSDAIAVDVVGTAAATASTTWKAVNYAFERNDQLRLPPLLVDVVDVLGTPLRTFDSDVRSVVISASVSNQAELNSSGVVYAAATTCDPSPGVASASLFLIQPSTGLYTLLFSSPGLALGRIPLYIVPRSTFESVQLDFAVEPFSFNSITKDNPLGSLPRQPVVVAVDPITRAVLNSTNDVTCIATVVPVNPSSESAPGVNLDTSVCNSAFGNCATFRNGYAAFSRLSFLGKAGETYTLVIQMRDRNSSEASSQIRFNITTANCTNLPDQLSTMSALLASATNTSLQAPPGGFLVKGWKYDPDVGLQCLYNGTAFNATIVDYCTALCLVVPRRAYRSLDCASNCCVPQNSSRIECKEPTGGSLFVCNGTCTANTTVPVVGAENIAFVGKGRQISNIPNVASNRTIPLTNGAQVVIAAPWIHLDAFLVQVQDTRGEFVDTADPTSDGAILTLSTVIAPVPNTAQSPSDFGTSYNDIPDSTCFVNSTHPMRFSNRSTLTCVVRDGLCAFDSLYLEYPRVGTYTISAANATHFSGNATFVLTVLAGRPSRLCIFTNMSGADSEIPHNFLLLHPPKLYALDVVGNIFQLPTGVELRSMPYVIEEQGPAPSSTSVRIVVDAYAMSINDSSASRNVSQYQLQDVGVLQQSLIAGCRQCWTFTSLLVNATYGYTFVLTFFSSGDLDTQLLSVQSPPLVLATCASSQIALWGNDRCETCFAGPTRCDGSQGSCFVCDGSTSMRVTTGFWRYSPLSYYAYSCPLASCIGGTELGQCLTGYKPFSPLCAACDKGYAPDFLGVCVKCAGIGLTAALFAIACIAAVIVLAVIVFVTVTEQQDDDNSLVLLLKVCVNFVQTSGTIGEFSMGMPSTVKQFLGIQNSLGGGAGISISPFNCLAPDFTFMTKYRIQMAGPPVALLTIAVVVRVITWRLQSDFRNLFNLVVMVFLFLVYQTIVSQSVGAMYCKPILGPESALVMSVLKEDVRVSCLDETYEKDFALVLYALAVYGLGIPAIALMLIMVSSMRDGWEETYVRYSFLISGYRLRYWYWEIVILARKVCLLLLVATTNNVTLQALLGIWLLTSCLVLTIRFQPFVKGVLNQAESLALLVQLVTVNVGLFFRTVSTSDTGCGALCIVVSTVLLLINASVFLYFGRHLLWEGYHRTLSAFGLDVVHSDNRRVVSLRNIKKTFLMQLKVRSSDIDFVNYKPSALSKRIQLASSKTGAVSFADEDDDAIELLTLRRIPTASYSSPNSAAFRSGKTCVSGKSVKQDSPPQPMGTDEHTTAVNIGHV